MPFWGPQPANVSLRSKCLRVVDQGELGSCTANVIAAVAQFDRKKQKTKPYFAPSRAFIYFNERAMEGTIGSDSGAMIRDEIKSAGTLGDCPAHVWRYDIAKFTEKPPASCYKSALKYEATEYQRVARSLSQFKGCLASGFPFVFG